LLNFHTSRYPRTSNLAAALLVCCLLSPLARAQDPRGALVGTVVDSGQARVVGAHVTLIRLESSLERRAITNERGEFRFEGLFAGKYRVTVAAPDFADAIEDVAIAVASDPAVSITLFPKSVSQSVRVEGMGTSLASEPIEITSSVQKATIFSQDLSEIPLAHRSFANVAWLVPMTEPVEPSDPTKARITAVSFAGSSGLNVDLNVDGGDNNDDYIGGFLQNYSPDAVQEFAVRTAQMDAETSRTNGGSVIITTRRGTDQWHGGGAFFYRASGLNARNSLDNPAPDPKQPFSRNNEVLSLGGPLKTSKFWFFSSFEQVHEDATISYSANSRAEFNALAGLAQAGLIPGVRLISVPSSVPVPFRDTLFTTRLDWAQSLRSEWFFRGSIDRNNTRNDLVEQATLPSTGVTTHSNYYSFLLDQQFEYSPTWIGALTLQASGFHHVKQRNSNLGFALAFPFSATFHTISGFETFGDNGFVTPITAFPILRDQQKYQFRYDVSHTNGKHSPKFGVNFIHEPVLDGVFAASAETLFVFPNDPSFYAANPSQFNLNLGCTPPPSAGITCTATPAGSGSFVQSVRRLGLYAQDSWRITPRFALNYGLRYDTTFGLFRAAGRDQNQNPAWLTLQALGIPLVNGIPHDYRSALAPRLGIAYAPGGLGKTVIRAGFGVYFNDLAQNGWASAFQAVTTAPGRCIAPGDSGCLAPGQPGALIDPHYRTPYALQASLGAEHQFSDSWRLNVHYEHQAGNHQYRRYEYVSGVTLPSTAPNISLFRTDNRSRYDGITFLAQHRLSNHFELVAHYTLASAATWGGPVGELFDYVNGVTDVRNPFGPGDHGPSGEDVRHRFVVAGVFQLPYQFEVSTLSQLESARPFTLATSVDVNNDGDALNDRAVVNGVQTSLNEFRGTPFMQVDLRVSREFRYKESLVVRPFVELFNLFNRANPGNNFITNLAALPIPASELGIATDICLDPACTTTRPIRSVGDFRRSAGALGDFFGPGTTVGLPFAAQFGVRISF
jgi:hypothetical protein